MTHDTQRHQLSGGETEILTEKKHSLLLLIIFTLVIVFPPVSHASIQIGTGNYVNTHLPMETYYGYSYSQQIYLKDEINVAEPISITKIEFYWNGNSSFSDNIVVYMGETSKSTFSSGSDWISVSGMTQVFSGLYPLPNYPGWCSITLDQPYTYNNIANLVIAVDENTAGWHGMYNDFYTSHTTYDRSIYFYADSPNPDPSSPPYGNKTHFRANLRITYESAGQAPTITTHPQSQAIDEGENVSFTVEATGGPAPTYKWYKDGEEIIGEISTTLSLVDVPLSEDGNTYYAVATNSQGSETSNAAVLSVIEEGGVCRDFPVCYSDGFWKRWKTPFNDNIYTNNQLGVCIGGLQCATGIKFEVDGNTLVNGELTATDLKLTTNPEVGFVLKSDAEGNATWQNNFWQVGPGGSFIYHNAHVTIGASSIIEMDAALDVYDGDIFVGAMGSKLRLGANSNDGAWVKTDGYGMPITFYTSDEGGASIETAKFYASGINFEKKTTFSGDALIAGSVGIGTEDPGSYKLAVEGTLGTRELVVTDQEWSDYVFSKDYELKSLEEVEKYIKKNKHLPGIPSEQEVKENGVNIGEMQAKLLEKIEEMTLHMIKMQKKIDKLEKEVASQSIK